MLLQFAPVAGGERQAVAVEDGALGDLAHNLLQARIVLVAAAAIGLHDQRACANGGAAAEDFDVGGFGHDYGGGEGEEDTGGGERETEGFGAGRDLDPPD